MPRKIAKPPATRPLVAEKLKAARLGQAAAIVRDGVDVKLSYMAFPREHWTRIRTNNVLERIMRDIRHRTRMVGNFPDGQSAGCWWRLDCVTSPAHAGANASTLTCLSMPFPVY